MEKGEGEEDINSILNTFNSKMSHINIMNMDGKISMPIRGAPVQVSSTNEKEKGSQTSVGWEDPLISAMKSTEPSSKSFVNVVTGNNTVRQNPKVNFRAMTNPDIVEHSDFVLPVAAVKAASNKFVNSLVRFFVGKKVAFPLVKNYVTNTWAKFGFEKVISDEDGLFYFKFESAHGLEQVLEQGPWLIRNVPLMLTKWSPNISLAKDKVTRVPIWVKLHKVPVVAYSEDGLSLITTQVGKPIMLDAFTIAMCVDAWGRIGYARALIEVSAEKELKQECPKSITVKPIPTNDVNDDGFITVDNRKAKGKNNVNNQKRTFAGVKVNNAKKTFTWELVKKPKDQKNGKEDQNNGIKLKNLFEKLQDQEDDIFIASCGESSGGNTMTKDSQCNEDTDSEVEETFVETNP
ncbi:retrovirus-related pol polyprotein from transposon TNT 1-94, partial [Tanacetum coccineum]